jgi:type II secretory pathway component GspD/PulD (secretin)
MLPIMKVTRVLVLPFMFLITPFFLQPSGAYARTLKGDPIVIQVIELDYADAGELASVLAPLVSPHGRIVAYARTNSLIIMDRASIVRKLVEIIKGPIDQHP